MVNWDFLYCTRGWADLKNLGDAFRGFTPPSHCYGALIALQSVEPAAIVGTVASGAGTPVGVVV